MSRAAFSLVELLVVIAIISILAGALSVGIGKSSNKSVQAAANTLYAQLQSARTVAVMKNATSRLLIEKVPESEWKTQRMIILTDPASNGQWDQASPWVRLPQGTFIILDGESPRSTKGGIDNAEHPPESMDYVGRQFAYYEFSPTGSCDRNVAARIIVGAGTHGEGGWVQQNQSLVHGLFLTRIGEAVFFEGPDHIMAASP
jgi:prepilin-type N-terminal cleavage/methylation domain-containing protein